MNSEGRAQAFETSLNISVYVNLDLDINIHMPHPTVGWSQSNLVPEAPQDMCVDGCNVGFDTAEEAVLARVFGSPDSSNTFCVGPDAIEVASAESGGTDAAFRDFNALSPTPEDSDMTDTFQTTIETDSMPDDRNIFEPMGFVNSAALQIPHSPSTWLPVSSQLQQQLDVVYATQLSQLAVDTIPPPVLYLPAAGPWAPPMPRIWSTPSDDVLLTDFTQTPQLNAEALAVDPILLMRSEGEVTHLPNGTYQPNLPNTDTYESEDENSVVTSIKKRGFHPSDSDSEPATKRIKTANSLAIAVEYLDSNDKDNGEMTLALRPRRDLLLNVAKAEHSLDASDDEAENNPPDESYDNDTSVPLSTNPALRKDPNWRYEYAKEICFRHQRRKEWNRRRETSAGAKGQAPNRKTQKLLEEMEDTTEFAEAHGYEVGESMGEDGDLRRSARRGARKDYAGQQ